MHKTPVKPSGSQLAGPFQFLDHGTVIVIEAPIDCIMSFSTTIKQIFAML